MALPSRTTALLIGGAILVAFVGHTAHWFLPVDDAFITYRHVDRLLAGDGLVFNAGERVEGYSNLLWALLLVIPGALGVPLPVAGSLLALICGAATLVVLSKAAARVGLEGPWRWGPALFLAAAAPWAYWSGAGLETTGFGLALVLLWWGYHRGTSPLWLLVGLGLTEWIRPEAIAAAPVLIFGLLWDRKVPLRRVAPGLGAFAAIWGGRLLWRKLYYGAWVSTPTTAKSVSGGDRVGEGLGYLSEAFVEDGLFLLLALGILGAVRARRAAVLPPAWTLAAGVAGYLVFVLQVGGDGLYRHRLVAHVLPLLCLLAGAGLAVLPKPSTRAAMTMATAGLLAWPALSGGPFYKGYAHANVAGVEHSWSTLGETLAELAPPDLVLATTAAGRIPFHSGLPTIDLLGLCDPEIARVHALAEGTIRPPAGHERADPHGVLERRPDLIFVSMLDALGPDRLVVPAEAHRTLLESGLTGYSVWFELPEFLDAYRPAFLLSADNKDAFSILVLRGGKAEAIDPQRLRSFEWTR